MTREEARQIALKQIEQELKIHGEDDVVTRAPAVGKCSWTYKEYKEAILEDKCLENSNTNPIDLVLRYDEYAKEHGLKGYSV